jgi:hypothetical protein
MRQYAHTRFFLALILTLAVWTLTSAPALAAVVHATYTFTDFTTRALSVKRVTVTPLASSADYAGAQLSNKPLIYSAPTYYMLTNGSITISNLVCGYAYKVAFSDGYSEPVITNYFGTNIATGTVVDANDYKTTYINFVNGSIIQVWYAYLSNTNSSGTSGALTNNDTRAVTLTNLYNPKIRIVGIGDYVDFLTNESGAFSLATDNVTQPGLHVRNADFYAENIYATAGIFSGSGAGLTSVHGSNSIAAGTISTNRMDAPAYVAFKNDVTQAGLAAGSYAVAGNGLGITNIFNKETGGGFQIVAHQYALKTTNVHPGVLGFDTSAHGPSHGIVLLGATEGDVVVNPGSDDGIFQIGLTSTPGNRIYLQYASDPANDGTNSTVLNGFSHPLQFRSLSKTNRQFHYPGIVGTSEQDTAGVTENGTLRFYARAPHWSNVNENTDAPTETGVEVLRVSTNAIQAASGIPFSSGSNKGISTNLVVLDSTTNPVYLIFTGGLLTYVGIDSDAQTYIAAVTNAGGTLTSLQRVAINQFVVSRKASGTWTNSDVIAPMMGGTAAAHAIYLKGSSNITWGAATAAPTHSANGAIFDGVNDYGNLNWKPFTGPNYTTNSGRLVIVIPQSSAVPIANSTEYAGAVQDPVTVRVGIWRNSATTIDIEGPNNAAGNGLSTINSISDERGVIISSRTASAAYSAYFWAFGTIIGGAGSSGSGTAVSTGNPNFEMTIAARNYQNFAPDRFAPYTLAGFESGSGVTASDAQAIRDAWQLLQNNLGR